MYFVIPAGYAAEVKEALAKARKNGVFAIRDVERGLGEIKVAEAGIVVDLFLS